MKYIIGLLLQLTFAHLFSQCPRLSGVLINSCGSNEGDNEFFTVRTLGQIDDITKMRIRYGTDPTFTTRLTIDGSVANIWVANSAYLALLNAQITVPGCSCVAVNTSASPDVAANKDLVIFSNSVGFNAYNLSNLCASSGNSIPVLFFDPALTVGGGSISGFNSTGNYGNYQVASQLRYFDFSIAGQPACDMQVSYDRSLLLNQSGVPGNQDGAAVTFQTDGTTTYSNSGCTTPQTPLPITWGKCEAIIRSDSAILISWQTLEDNNESIYTILKGKSPQNMIKVADIANKPADNHARNYQFEDKNPFIGFNFYQIQQTDLNGNSSFSPVFSALYHKNIPFQVQAITHNSADLGQIHLLSNTENQIQITFYDNQGKVLHQQKQTLPIGESQIPLFDFPISNQLLFYHISDENGNQLVGKTIW